MTARFHVEVDITEFMLRLLAEEDTGELLTGPEWARRWCRDAKNGKRTEEAS